MSLVWLQGSVLQFGSSGGIRQQYDTGVLLPS